MNEKNNGGAAFPCHPNSQAGHFKQDGMTLRDYFAGEALNGMLADWESAKAIIAAHGGGNAEFGHAMAAMAYGISDAMLAERAK